MIQDTFITVNLFKHRHNGDTISVHEDGIDIDISVLSIDYMYAYFVETHPDIKFCVVGCGNNEFLVAESLTDMRKKIQEAEARR